VIQEWHELQKGSYNHLVGGTLGRCKTSRTLFSTKKCNKSLTLLSHLFRTKYGTFCLKNCKTEVCCIFCCLVWCTGCILYFTFLILSKQTLFMSLPMVSCFLKSTLAWIFYVLFPGLFTRRKCHTFSRQKCHTFVEPPRTFYTAKNVRPSRQISRQMNGEKHAKSVSPRQAQTK
jgi:hypothetical protein